MSGISSIPYSPILLSHQTNLSITASSFNTYYNLGSSITIPRNGIIKVSFIGYGGSGANNYISYKLTRNSKTYIPTSTITFTNSTAELIIINNSASFEIPVLKNDVIQFTAYNDSLTNTYINDLVVILI